MKLDISILTIDQMVVIGPGSLSACILGCMEHPTPQYKHFICNAYEIHVNESALSSGLSSEGSSELLVE